MSISVFLSLLTFLAHTPASAEEIHPDGANTYQMVTGDDLEEDRDRWNALFRTRDYVFGREPAKFLQEHIGQVGSGRALDVASGEGRNSVFLAKKGFVVDALDISEVALRKAQILAKENHVAINVINADLNQFSFRPETYDLIVVIQFLSRSSIPALKKALKKGGYIVYENYTTDQTKFMSKEKKRLPPRDELLEKSELKNLFKDYKVVFYEEKTKTGDVGGEQSAVASLIAQKP